NIIIARNLEMLAIAVRGKSLCKNNPILIYESLDIHRLLLNKGIAGKILRKLEGWLSKRASILITSSPAFIREYFVPLSEVKIPIKLIENKVFNPDIENNTALTSNHKKSKPWKIGWFGAIRCKKSLNILRELVENSNGNIEVIIRGRPSFDQFDNFYKDTTSISGLKFLGEYQNPDDLEKIYGEVHFTWAVDMFEEGLNSAWLLPNRLYEGCLYGSIPIAIEAVETGNFIEKIGIGVAIKEPKLEFLSNFFKSLTQEKYNEMQASLIKIPKSKWVYDTNDCKELVGYLGSLNNKNKV
ncbi:MAG: glycosyl transferase family 1, partial [Rickettsiales bacterium]